MAVVWLVQDPPKHVKSFIFAHAGALTFAARMFWTKAINYVTNQSGAAEKLGYVATSTQ